MLKSEKPLLYFIAFPDLKNENYNLIRYFKRIKSDNLIFKMF
jgi:hypothetical protein